VPFRTSLLISLICATVLITGVTGANAITVEVEMPNPSGKAIPSGSAIRQPVAPKVRRETN